jgi:hypothetical protein
MDVTLTSLDDARAAVSGAAAGSAKRTKALSPRSAATLYFAGALIETLGLALIAAYGLVLAGAGIAFCGLVLATAGNNRWPEGEGGPSHVALLKSYLRRTRGGDR